jgi:hypothetical protein
VRLADPSRSRIVLIGTPLHTFPDECVPDVPAVAANLADLAGVFTDPEIGGYDAEHCISVPADVTLEDVGASLTEAAAAAEDLLLIYYCGHGLLDPRGNLYLALTRTRREMLAYTALAYESLRNTCLDSKADSRVLIIDSCFSGRAIGKDLGDPAQIIQGLEVAGTYILASAPANSTALYLEGERHTAFTGRLLDLLRDGDPQTGPMLTMGTVYRHLRSRMRAEGLPEPQQRGTATADLLALVRNRRPVPPEPAELPDEIRENLDSRFPYIRLGAVNTVAEWLTDPDPCRAVTARTVLQNVADHDNPSLAKAARDHLDAAPALVTVRAPCPGSRTPASLLALGLRLANRAADVAETIVDPARKELVLVGVVRAVAQADPIQAERVAGLVTDPNRRARALAEVVRTVAETDTARAVDIAAQAAEHAENLDDPDERAFALINIAQAVATADPGRAVRIIGSIGDSARKDLALAEIARAAALTEAVQAARIAGSIADPNRRARALADVVEAVVGTDPFHAARIAATITDSNRRSRALAEIAQAVAQTDPAQAVHIAAQAAEYAGSITDPDRRAFALAEVARAVARTDADQAARIAGTITDPDRRAFALAEVVHAVAQTDPARATRIAESITDASRKVLALAEIVHAVAQADPVYATQIATRAAECAAAISDPHRKASTLTVVAEAVAQADPARATVIAGAVASPERKAAALALVVRVVA